MSHCCNLQVLLVGLLVDLLVVEAFLGGDDAVLLPHLEVLSEVLVSAPPVRVDHVQALVPADLMEVGVAHVVLLAVHRVPSVSMWLVVGLVRLSNHVSPLSNHSFLLLLRQQVQVGRLEEMEDEAEPDIPDSILLVERLYFPITVPEGILVESCDVLESSPSLGIISGFPSSVDELGKVSVGLLGKSSIGKVRGGRSGTCQSCQLAR